MLIARQLRMVRLELFPSNSANTSPANINQRVEIFDQYSRVLKYAGVQFSGATFNFDNCVPSANLPMDASANVLSVEVLTVTRIVHRM